MRTTDKILETIFNFETFELYYIGKGKHPFSLMAGRNVNEKNNSSYSNMHVDFTSHSNRICDQ